MNIEYPVRFSKKARSPEEKEKRAATLYGHENEVGFYPVGRLNNWHGGVHIEGKYDVTAIADGRIIAYRVPEKNFSQPLLIGSNGETKEFSHSNGFVLIQHDYLSPNEQKLTFYSLYHHLMTKVEMEQDGKVPDLFADYSVTVEGGETAKGLNVRSATEIIEGRPGKKALGKVQSLVPIGHEVELIPEVCLQEIFEAVPPLGVSIPSDEEPHWSADYSNYRKIRYTELFDGVCRKRTGYAYMLGLEHVSGMNYRVITIEDSIGKSAKGVMVLDKPDLFGRGRYLDILKKGETVAVEKVEGKKEWWKIKGKEEYIRMTGKKDAVLLKVQASFREDIPLDEVVNVEIPIEAGTIIGHTGSFQMKANAYYQAVHVEVFSADEGLEDFLANALEDDRHFWVTEEGAEGIVMYDVLETTFDPDSENILEHPILKGEKVKIFNKVGKYIQIGFENIDKTVKQASKWLYLDDEGPKAPNDPFHGKGYEEATENVKKEDSYWIRDYATIDSIFDGALSYNSLTDQSYFQMVCIKSKGVKGENGEQGREVRFVHPRAGQRMWVDCSVLGRPPEGDLDFLDAEVNAAEEDNESKEDADDEIAEIEEVDKEEEKWITLLEDITTYWERMPTSDPSVAQPVLHPLTIKQSSLKEKYAVAPKEDQATEWCYATGNYFDENGEPKRMDGWLKKEFLIQKFVHNWYDFGFTLDHAGEEYIHSFKHDEPASEFIEKIWEIADVPQIVTNESGEEVILPSDHKLSPKELQDAMMDKKKGRILSHMICKHSSEWNFDRHAQVEEELMEFVQVGIDAEEDPEKKEALQSKCDSILEFTKARMEKMAFWAEIQDGPIEEASVQDDPHASQSAAHQAFYQAYPPGLMVSEEEGAEGEDDDVMLLEEEIDWPPPRTFPVGDDVLHHFHAIAFVEQMRRITASRYRPDHGDFHDPLINPQVRGWYNPFSTTNKDSEITGWNPYASMLFHDGKEHYHFEEIEHYGRPQRLGNPHGGLDIYAPVGTPIYACVDGKITIHKFWGGKSGFYTQLVGQYRGQTYLFQYLHLMEFEQERFRFFNNYKNIPNIPDGWLRYDELPEDYKDPLKEEPYEISFDGNLLQFDNNFMDVERMLTMKRTFARDGHLKVKKGDFIGYTGSTGNSYQGKSKNHLHFGIKDLKGNRLSPYELFGEYINLDRSGESTSALQDGVISSENWK